MKKLIAGSALVVICLIAFASSVSATEGLVDLSSHEVSCKGVSIYQAGNYRVTGRCDGLVYPYETTYNKYVLWGKTKVRGEMTRIAEIDRGYFSGNISSPFEAMYITAEKDGLVRKASDKLIVSGKLEPFNFDKSNVTVAPSPAATTATTTKTTVSTADSSTKSTAGAVVGKIVSSLLVVILVIVGLAIGASLLFRNRGSVSA